MGTFILWVIILVSVTIWWKRKERKKVKAATEEKEWVEEKKTVITEGNMREKWENMLDGVGGHGEELMNIVARRIENDIIPNVYVSRRPMCLEGAAEKRPFVVIENSDKMLQAYKVVFNATDYGDRLNVVWYLLFDITEIKDGAKYGKSMAEVQALTNYVGVVHRLITSEVRQMMKGLKLDFTKVDSHTSGFLNLS